MSPPFLSAFDSENNTFKLLQLASFVFTQDHFRGHCSDWLLPVLDCRQFHIIRCEHYISNLAESCQFYSVLNHIIYGSDFQSAPCWFSGLNQNWFIQKTCCPSLNTTLALRRQSPTQWTETLLLSYCIFLIINHILAVYAWALSGYSGFLLLSKEMTLVGLG